MPGTRVHIFKIGPDSIVKEGVLPETSVGHNEGIGIWRIGNKYLALKHFSRWESDDWPMEFRGYYLQPYFLDPNDLSFSTAGSPLKISPEGKNFQNPQADQYDNSFILRGEARFHLVDFSET